MILLADYDVLFVHVPQTGGTAVRRYLQENLGGVQVADQHEIWERMRRSLPEPSRLRVMTTIRNPLDQTVSSYFKRRSDHKGRMSSGAASERRRREWESVVNQDASFEDWFMRYRSRVYSPVWLGSVRHSRWVLRFESLAADLHSALLEAGVVDPAPLRVVNATERPRVPYAELYLSDLSRMRASRIFGPFMAEFGYGAPDGWPWRVPMAARLEYAAAHHVRRSIPARSP